MRFNKSKIILFLIIKTIFKFLLIIAKDIILIIIKGRIHVCMIDIILILYRNLFEKYKSIYRPHQTLIERYIDKKKENGNCSGVNKRKTKIGRSRNILLSLINDINLNKERGLHNGDPHSQFIKTRNNYKFLTFNTITDSKSNSQLFTQCYNDYYNQTNCTSKILKSSSSSSTAFSQKVKDYLNKKDSISHKDKYSVASKNKTIFNVLKRKLIFTNRLSNS